ncbi:MAG: phosphatase PAP2 family protein [Pseudomonadota bacterium]
MTQAQDALTAPRMRFSDAAQMPPLLLIATMTALALAFNQWTQLRWLTPAYQLIWMPALCCASIVIYATRRSQPAIRETGIYLGFWLFYPLFAAQLTYIATVTKFPLQDALFIRLDGMLGFVWGDWMKFSLDNPLLLAVQQFAYDSSYWQPLLYVPFFALFGPRGRNGEFLTAMLLGLIATILIYMFLPTLGPADMAGQKAEQGQIIRALRVGSVGPYPYFGIVSFPSFHTVMALLFIVAHRGNRITFPVVLAFNLVMLTAIPYSGDHYLTDMIAGGMIALAAFAAARLYYRRFDEAVPSVWTGPFAATKDPVCVPKAPETA